MTAVVLFLSTSGEGRERERVWCCGVYSVPESAEDSSKYIVSFHVVTLCVLVCVVFNFIQFCTFCTLGALF